MALPAWAPVGGRGGGWPVMGDARGNAWAAASLLKDLAVPARDTQIILGHAHISTTQQIYTHVNEAARREALTRLSKLLGGTG
jgi:integrase